MCVCEPTDKWVYRELHHEVSRDFGGLGGMRFSCSRKPATAMNEPPLQPGPNFIDSRFEPATLRSRSIRIASVSTGCCLCSCRIGPPIGPFRPRDFWPGT